MTEPTATTAAAQDTGDGTADGPDAVVEARGLTKRFGDEVAVDDLSLSVSPGTIFGFIGPSGSGKTTTVRLLTGVQSPTEGEVHVFGVAPSAFTEHHRARIGYMPQLSVLFPHLSIMENLKFVASIYGMPWGRRGRLNQALEFVELRADKRKRLRHASGGMQRRLALAAALVNEPQLLFLDEPTAGIDPVLRRKFWDHFESLRDEGRTLFVTTQYVGEAAYCDRIGLLREGRLLTVDTPEGLRRQAFGGEVIDLIVADRIDQDMITDVTLLDYVLHAQRTRVDGRGMRITVEDADRVIPRLQQWLVERGVAIESVDRYLPPFDDVFVKLVQGDRAEMFDGATAEARREPDAVTVRPPDADTPASADELTARPTTPPPEEPGAGRVAAAPVDAPVAPPEDSTARPDGAARPPTDAGAAPADAPRDAGTAPADAPRDGATTPTAATAPPPAAPGDPDGTAPPPAAAAEPDAAPPGAPPERDGGSDTAPADREGDTGSNDEEPRR